MSSLRTVVVTVTCLGGGALMVALLRTVRAYVSNRNLRLHFEQKCKEWPKDVVVLHGTPRGKITPHPSPFVLKLETFLRMHQIPYIFDHEFPKGDKQKMPWITLNNEHFTDSQLIIQLLSEKYGIRTTVHDDEKESWAAVTMARIVIDEHFFWGLLLWRYVYSKGEDLHKIMNMKSAELQAFQKMVCSKYKEFSWYQGIGRHSEKEVIAIMNDDLRALSRFLGNKQFFMGKEPCNDDCAIFGMLAQVIWCDVKSPFAKLINEELVNLKDYCFRMKDRYWKDWDAVINGAKMNEK